MAEALIGLGGNVGDVRETLDRAVAALCEAPGVRLMAQSSDYRTPPWGVEDQPAFVNRCIAVATELAPRALLDRALAIEQTLGRDRTHERRWGPRRVDIDLLAYDDVTLIAPALTLPVHTEIQAEDAEGVLVDAPVEVFGDGALEDVELFGDDRFERTGREIADVDRHKAAP